MSHSPEQIFQKDVEAFLARTGIAASTFGLKSCGDPNFLTDLKDGQREFKRSTIEKVGKWMDGFDAGAAFAAERANEEVAA